MRRQARLRPRGDGHDHYSARPHHGDHAQADHHDAAPDADHAPGPAEHHYEHEHHHDHQAVRRHMPPRPPRCEQAAVMGGICNKPVHAKAVKELKAMDDEQLKAHCERLRAEGGIERIELELLERLVEKSR